jgi:hypothetical protein
MRRSNYHLPQESLTIRVPNDADVVLKDFFRLTVDYRLNLSEMVVMSNHELNNDSPKDGICIENFPLRFKKPQEIEVALVDLRCSYTFRKFHIRLSQMGFRPGTLPELLALGAHFRDLPPEYLIYASGSIWVRHRIQVLLPFIMGSHRTGLRGVMLDWSMQWGFPGCAFQRLFLAVRK